MKIDGSPYLPRFIDPVVERHLGALGAVEIAGTMWSGKTWSARTHGKSEVSLDDEQTRALAEMDTDVVLRGDFPHVADEWQEAPKIWDAVCGRVDKAAGKRGLYILTGSSRPSKEKVHHMGSGRISRLMMWLMTLAESGHSKGSVSISGLFDGVFENGPVETSLEEIAALICRGGWPASIVLDDNAAQMVPTQYLDALLAKRDESAPGTERELRLFLRSLARNIGSAPTLEALAADAGFGGGAKASDAATRKTRSFLDYFLGRYVVCDLQGWDAPIKSPSRLRTKPKHGFADPSLSAAFLGMGRRLLWETSSFSDSFSKSCACAI